MVKCPPYYYGITKLRIGLQGTVFPFKSATISANDSVICANIPVLGANDLVICANGLVIGANSLMRTH
jgi:hypothetical protein